MSKVVDLRRSATMLWKPDAGDVVPVHSVSELQALVTRWRGYGATATVFGQSGDRREATVTSLGDDGWLLHVRDATMRRNGWSYSSRERRQRHGIGRRLTQEQENAIVIRGPTAMP